jgi:hypothetical protein
VSKFKIFLVVWLLLATASTQASSRPKWHLSVGFGLSFFPFGFDEIDTELSKQVEAMGIKRPIAGMQFSLLLDRRILDLLVVGAEIDYHLYPGGFGGVANVIHDNSLSPGFQSNFHRLSGWAIARLSFRGHLLGRGADYFEGGPEIGLGGGSLIWQLRGQADSAGFFQMRLGISANWFWENMSFGIRLLWPLFFSEDFGPNNLNHSPTFGMVVDLRMGWHW